MGGTYGTKETCEIIAFGLGLASSVQQAKANDGVIDTKDLPLLLPVIPTVLPAIENISAVPAELGELDEEDLATVQAFVLAKLPAVGEQWTTIATNALVAGLAIYRIIKAL